MFRNNKELSKQFFQREEERKEKVSKERETEKTSREKNAEVLSVEQEKVSRFKRAEINLAQEQISSIDKYLKLRGGCSMRGSLNALKKQAEIIKEQHDKAISVKDSLKVWGDAINEHLLDMKTLELALRNIKHLDQNAQELVSLKSKAIESLENRDHETFKEVIPRLFGVSSVADEEKINLKLYHGVVQRNLTPGRSWAEEAQKGVPRVSVVEYVDKLQKIMVEGLIPSDRDDQVYSDVEVPAIYFFNFLGDYGNAGFMISGKDCEEPIFRGGAEHVVYTEKYDSPRELYVKDPNSDLVWNKQEVFDLIKELKERDIKFSLIKPEDTIERERE